MQENKIQRRRLYLRVSEYEFKQFEKAKEIGVSQRSVFEQICEQLKGIPITVYDKKKRKSFTFPLNFMCDKKLCR